MAKPSSKHKIAVGGDGPGAELKHNPFGALGGARAPEPAATTPQDTATTPEPQAQLEPKSRGRLILRREKKQRGGKTVVVIAGLRKGAHLPESEIAKLAQHIKQQLGCGGTVEPATGDTEIVIQGDQPARIAELLRAQRFKVDGVTG